MKERVLSGMRPTGTLHIGHLSVLENWIKLQEQYECFYFAADYHALTTGFDDTSNIKENIRNMVIDWLAVGVDPEKATIFVQSQVPEHAELFLLLSMMTPLSWLHRCPTYKAQVDQFRESKGKDITTYGFLGYPVLMASDILLYLANYVPVGEDQLPHLEITRELARRFNHLYKKDILIEPKGLLSSVPLITGTDGRKMSKSYNNQINIVSDREELTKKIKSMITDPSRIRKDDLGHPEVCTVFSYQKLYNKKEVLEIESNCQKGTIGCMDCKKKLIESMNIILEPICQKRREVLTNNSYVDDVLRDGQKKASALSSKTILEVKMAMGLI